MYLGDYEEEGLDQAELGVFSLHPIMIEANGANGQLTMENGDVYTGSWVTNKKHGIGKYDFFQPEVTNYRSILSQFSSSPSPKKKGDGFALGDKASRSSRFKYYHGQFEDDMMSGEGIL